MIKIYDVGQISDKEIAFLKTLSDGNEGYLSMYAQLCKSARVDFKKNDFECWVIIKKNDVGNVDCWAMIQNLFYRHEDYLDMSIWTPRSKRGQGHASAVMNFIGDRFAGDKISIWLQENNIGLFNKFKNHPFYHFCIDTYHKTGQYKTLNQ